MAAWSVYFLESSVASASYLLSLFYILFYIFSAGALKEFGKLLSRIEDERERMVRTTLSHMGSNSVFHYFIYSQFHDNIYIQVYTCANGLDIGIAYICPLQLVRQFKYIYTHIVTQIQKLQAVQIHVYIYKVLVIGMNMNVNSNR